MFRRRPKKAFFVYIHVFTSATMPPTGGQYAKRIRIRSTTHLPIIDRPEIPAVIYDFPQSLPFILAWQVPAIRTDSMHRIFHRTGHHKALALTIRIQKTGTIDRSAPQVQASVFFTILDRIVVAETARIQGSRRLQIAIIQVFRHQFQSAIFPGLVDSPIAFIRHFTKDNIFSLFPG